LKIVWSPWPITSYNTLHKAPCSGVALDHLGRVHARPSEIKDGKGKWECQKSKTEAVEQGSHQTAVTQLIMLPISVLLVPRRAPQWQVRTAQQRPCRVAGSTARCVRLVSALVPIGTATRRSVTNHEDLDSRVGARTELSPMGRCNAGQPKAFSRKGTHGVDYAAANVYE
jgi:hypothetical protein